MKRDADGYDLFVSYASNDNKDGFVHQFVERLVAQHRAFCGRELRVFLDHLSILACDDWEARLIAAIGASRLMLAFVSPSYRDSGYCQKEWRWYADREMHRFVVGEGIGAVYVVEVPGFGGQDVGGWLGDASRRNYVDVRPWFPDGAACLQRDEVKRILDELSRGVEEKLEREDLKEASDRHSTLQRYNPNFVGRTEDLRALRHTLERGACAAIAAVQGLGGIGKTELAVAYAHAFAFLYPGGRYEVPCQGRSDLREAVCAALVGALGLQLSEEEARDSALQYRRVLHALAQRGRALILLDNVDQAGLLAPDQTQHLPPSGQAHAVATTRLTLKPNRDLVELRLDTLPEEDALLLIERFRGALNEEERDAAREIVRRVGGLTLAVEVVAAYLGRHRSIPVADYLCRLQKEGLEAVEDAGAEAAIRHGEASVSAVLAPTLESVERRCPAWMSVLVDAALMPPDQVPEAWLRELAAEAIGTPEAGRPDPWAEARDELVGLGLLAPSDAPGLFRMHRLRQEAVARHAGGEAVAERQEGLDRLAQERAEALRESWVDRSARWEVAPLTALAELWMAAGRLEGARLANGVSSPVRDLGNLQEARRLLLRALEIDKAAYEPTHPNLATTCSNLAMVEKGLGNLQEARRQLLRALEIDEAAYEPTHPALATACSNLAMVEKDFGNLQEARRLLLRALEIKGAAYEPTHPTLATTCSNLAMVERDLGNPWEAKRLLLRALEIQEAAYEPTHPNLAAVCSNLALVERDLGNPREAKRLLLRALEIEEAAYEPTHPNLAIRYSNLATVEQDLGNLQEAGRLMVRALRIREQAFGPEHPRTRAMRRWLEDLGA